MVEFDNLDAATRARENLNGADIYAGCCTLKIDYAKVRSITIDQLWLSFERKLNYFVIAAREIERVQERARYQLGLHAEHRWDSTKCVHIFYYFFLN